MTKLQPLANHYGSDVSADVPASPDGVITLRGQDSLIWEHAAPLLAVRDNDAHTLYAYALAMSFLSGHPEADPEVVGPAILLHDIGWSQVPPDEVLSAISPSGGRPDLVLLHEREGRRLAEQILSGLGYDPGRSMRILDIIDGHDSRREALDIDDAIVKDADKTWRLSPHGLDTIMDWFGLDRDHALRLCSARVHGHLFTDEARAAARSLSALESATLWTQRRALLER